MVDWSPDGALLVTSCQDATCLDPPNDKLEVWDLRAGKHVASLAAGRAHPRPRLDVRGRVLSFADPDWSDGHLTLWDTNGFRELWSQDLQCINESAVDAPGQRFFAVSCNGNISAYDSAARSAFERPREEADVSGGSFVGMRYLSRQGRVLLVHEGGPQLLDGTTLKLVSQPLAVPSKREGVSWSSAWALSPDERQLALGATDASISIVGIPDFKLIHTVKLPPDVEAITLTWLSNDQLASSNADGSVTLVDAVSGKQRQLVRPNGTSCTSILDEPKVARGSRKVAFFDVGCKLRVADVAAMVPLFTIDVAPATAASTGGTPEPQVAWSPRGDLLAVVGGDCKLSLYDAMTGQLRAQPTVFGSGLCASPVSFSPDGRFLAAGDGSATVFRIADGRHLSLTTIQQGDGRRGFAVSNGDFAGDPSLAFCSPEPAKRESPSLIVDFMSDK